ncbi:retrovirus-related pol polyprotein from transposon TNT 1-94 [Tanacetum coccineum]
MKKNLVDGLPKFKYDKDHLCSACEQGNSKKASFPPKLVPCTESKLKLLHMDLYGPIRVAGINGKIYILAIVDDYSRYTWVFFLHTKDEAHDMIINFITKIQRSLKAQVLKVWSDNGTDFKNEKLRTNHTLVEAARTMLIFSKTLEFLWAEAIATACFTQNRSLDRDDLGKMKPKANIEDEAPQLVTSSEEPIANEATTPVLNENANETVREDVSAFDRNEFYNPFYSPVLEEAESSSTFQDPSNMHEFYQPHRSTDKWTKIHPIKQVIGDLSKCVMTRRRLHRDAEMCMYTLTVSTTEPKNIKEAMLDHSWIESMQEEPNHFKRLDVWELVEHPVGKNITVVKWLWKNKTDAENTVIRNKSHLVAKGYGVTTRVSRRV